MPSKKHTPVRHIDRLIKLYYRMAGVRRGVEETDPEVAMLLLMIEQKLGHAMHMINRDGLERDNALAQFCTVVADPVYLQRYGLKSPVLPAPTVTIQ